MCVCRKSSIGVAGGPRCLRVFATRIVFCLFFYSVLCVCDLYPIDIAFNGQIYSCSVLSYYGGTLFSVRFSELWRDVDAMDTSENGWVGGSKSKRPGRQQDTSTSVDAAAGRCALCRSMCALAIRMKQTIRPVEKSELEQPFFV